MPVGPSRQGAGEAEGKAHNRRITSAIRLVAAGTALILVGTVCIGFGTLAEASVVGTTAFGAIQTAKTIAALGQIMFGFGIALAILGLAKKERPTS